MIWLAHMKTTVDIADGLLSQAKQRARDRRQTLRQLIEEGLRRVLDNEQSKGRFHLKDGSVDGCGLQPGIREGDWEQLRELIYGI